MVQRNPYETNTPVDVPNFMKQSTTRKPKKEDVDMSYFKLNEEEIKKSDEQPLRRRPTIRKKRVDSLLLIVTCVCGVVAIVSIVLSISSSSKYKSLNGEYETYKQTTQSQIDRVNKEMSTLKKEYEDYKIAHPETAEETKEETKAEQKEEKKEETKQETTSTISSFKAGKYKIRSVQIREEAGKEKSPAKYDDLPDFLKWISYDNGVIVDGSDVNIKEVKVVADGVWGKLADNCWVCMKDGSSVFVE